MTRGLQGLAGPAPGEPTVYALLPHPEESLHVLQRGRGYIHPAVEVLDPVNRYLRNPVAPLLGQEQELGVEEPLVVLHPRQELLRHAALDRLKAALRVREAVAEHRLYEKVVAPRDQLPLPLARHHSAPQE